MQLMPCNLRERRVINISTYRPLSWRLTAIIGTPARAGRATRCTLNNLKTDSRRSYPQLMPIIRPRASTRRLRIELNSFPVYRRTNCPGRPSPARLGRLARQRNTPVSPRTPTPTPPDSPTVGGRSDIRVGVAARATPDVFIIFYGAGVLITPCSGFIAIVKELIVFFI